MYFVWDDTLEIGVPIIDEQHRRIVDYINALYLAEKKGDTTKVAQILNRVLDYSINHFSFEEHLMEEAHYRFVGAHKRVHQLFSQRVLEYKRRFENGEDIASELNAMLKTWLIKHIKEEDTDYLPAVMPVATSVESSGWISGLVQRLFG